MLFKIKDLSEELYVLLLHLLPDTASLDSTHELPFALRHPQVPRQHGATIHKHIHSFGTHPRIHFHLNYPGRFNHIFV